MSYSPNLPITSGWKSTLALAFQLLRRIKFIIEEDWSFGSFDPQIDYNGMTTTNNRTVHCRYLKIGKMLFLSLNIQCTLAAPLASSIFMTLPSGCVAANYDDSTNGYQGGPVYLAVNGIAEVGYFFILQNTSLITFKRPTAAAYLAGTFQVRENFFIEII